MPGGSHERKRIELLKELAEMNLPISVSRETPREQMALIADLINDGWLEGHALTHSSGSGYAQIDVTRLLGPAEDALEKNAPKQQNRPLKMTDQAKIEQLKKFVDAIEKVVKTADTEDDCRVAYPRFKKLEERLIGFLRDGGFKSEAAVVTNISRHIKARYGAPVIHSIEEDAEIYVGKLNALIEDLSNPIYSPGAQPDADVSAATGFRAAAGPEEIPTDLVESLGRFRKAHPDPTKVCFIMMRFGKTKAHAAIVAAIRATLEKHGIKGLRADDREFHEDLFPNVRTYLYGCAFGVAVYERLEADVFNPNVSLEIGFMFAMRKPVLILKDKTLENLHTDLIGKLYRGFDPQDPKNSIPPQVTDWLRDRDLAVEPTS